MLKNWGESCDVWFGETSKTEVAAGGRDAVGLAGGGEKGL